LIEVVEGCFVRRELSERVDGFLVRGAVGRVVVGVGREVEVGRAGAITRSVRDGIVDAGRAASFDPRVTVPKVRGRGTVAAGFKTALGRLNIGSSKSSSSTISPALGYNDSPHANLKSTGGDSHGGGGGIASVSLNCHRTGNVSKTLNSSATQSTAPIGTCGRAIISFIPISSTVRGSSTEETSDGYLAADLIPETQR
jgi:hypothetical protein